MIMSLFSILVGILKMNNFLESIVFSIGDFYFKIPSSNSLLYILLVNIIGGVFVFYHSLKTIKFKMKNSNKKSSTNLSNYEVFTAYYSILIAIFLLIKLLVILTGLEFSEGVFILLSILVLITFGLYPISILMLVSRNLALNNKIK